MHLEYIPRKQVPQRIEEGWAIVSKQSGDYAALMEAPKGWGPVIVVGDPIALLFSDDSQALHRIDGKPAFHKPSRFKATCRICDRPHHAKGFCDMHYKRLKATGNPRGLKRHGPAPSNKRCSQCRRRAIARGFCNRHYLQSREAARKAERPQVFEHEI